MTEIRPWRVRSKYDPTTKTCVSCFAALPNAKRQCPHCGELTNAGLKAWDREADLVALDAANEVADRVRLRYPATLEEIDEAIP